ncbi:MAG: hypothetical protein MHM6MM_007269 [Cercozoa sp. M6MM]
MSRLPVDASKVIAPDGFIVRADVDYDPENSGPTSLVDESDSSEFRKLDVLVPDDVSPGETLPCVIAIHGGAWRSGDKTELWHLAPKLREAGFKCVLVSLNYALSEQTGLSYPTFVDDCRLGVQFAIDFVQKLGVLDPTRVSVVGHSAGGHAASCMCLSDESNSLQVQTYVSVEGILDVPLLNESFPTYAEWFLNTAFTADREAWKRASPALWLQDAPDNIVFIHSKQDELVDEAQIQSFVRNHPSVAADPDKTQVLLLDFAGNEEDDPKAGRHFEVLHSATFFAALAQLLRRIR